MRSSLSCEACRRSKVKCAHSGSPPCQRCKKSAIAGCLLTRPKPSRRHDPARGRKPTPSAPQASSSVVEAQQQMGERARQPSSDKPAQTPRHGEGHGEELAVDPPPPTVAKLHVHAHLASLSPGVILKALSVFINSFPELAIVHLPTFVESLDSPEGRALLAAVLAVTRAQPSVLTAAWARGLLPREHYACYATDALSAFILQPPKIQVVQALLIIALHEWGSRDFHKAWIYCGIAIRIMQALYSLRVAPQRRDTCEHPSDAISLAIETRTYWACFILDCMINSGTYNPPMLPMSEMRKLKIARPLGIVDFAFGPDAPPLAVGAAQIPTAQASGPLDFTQSFEILVGGFDLWNQVMTFIFNDGRRAPGMCAPQNCPWVPTSPWSLSISQIEAWRGGQHSKLHYPTHSVAIHMTLGFGETFVYLNLLYYTSTLMLHREYFPFLPAPDSEPQGPTDHSRLQAPAPPGWWEESGRQLFDAAKHISTILHEASECGVQVMTPFAGFCAFSAAYINLYVFRYPRMNFNRSPDAEACLTTCLDYLQELRHVWRIADGWIKTIHQASLLYQRATKDKERYQGRTRDDFDTLHRSLHEFRVVDRSDDHHRELDGVERAAVSPRQETGETTAPTNTPECLVDTGGLLLQLLAEVNSNLDEQGAWSQWWPPAEQVEPRQMG